MARNAGYADIERNYDGSIARYKYKRTGAQNHQDDDTRKMIDLLKNQLKSEVADQFAQHQSIFRQTRNPKDNNPIARGRILKAKNADEKQTNNNIERIIRMLASLGVKTNRDKVGRVTFTNINEKGGTVMKYDVERLKQMKLETFQENAAGTITTEATNYLLAYFDVMIEAANIGDANELVMDYVAACKDGDEDKKAELKEKLIELGKCKKTKKELSSIRETLSDKEKKFVDDLDKEICSGGSGSKDAEESLGESADEGANSSESDVGKDREKQLKSMGNIKKNLESGVKNAGTDSKDSFEQLLSAASESAAISDIGRGAMLEYVTESVASGNMDADTEILLTSLVRL